nr:Phosphoinositide 3-kinase regulatory subunit 4 like [Ipomoea batatas]
MKPEEGYDLTWISAERRSDKTPCQVKPSKKRTGRPPKHSVSMGDFSSGTGEAEISKPTVSDAIHLEMKMCNLLVCRKLYPLINRERDGSRELELDGETVRSSKSWSLMESTTVFCGVETAFRCQDSRRQQARVMPRTRLGLRVRGLQADPVARGHERLPMVPFYDSTVVATKSHGFDFASPGNESTLFSIHLVDGQITPNSILEDPLDYKNSSSSTNNDMSISGISHASETTNRKKKGGGFLPGIMLSLSNRRKGAPSRSPLS